MFFFSFMKGSNCSHKLRYKEYLKLICSCLSQDMYTEMTCMRISYGEITYVYGKAHMTVM
jgi:hypothetical protein